MNKVLASLLILVFGSQYNISNASMKNTDDEAKIYRFDVVVNTLNEKIDVVFPMPDTDSLHDNDYFIMRENLDLFANVVARVISQRTNPSYKNLPIDFREIFWIPNDQFSRPVCIMRDAAYTLKDSKLKDLVLDVLEEISAEYWRINANNNSEPQNETFLEMKEESNNSNLKVNNSSEPQNETFLEMKEESKENFNDMESAEIQPAPTAEPFDINLILDLYTVPERREEIEPIARELQPVLNMLYQEAVNDKSDKKEVGDFADNMMEFIGLLYGAKCGRKFYTRTEDYPRKMRTLATQVYNLSVQLGVAVELRDALLQIMDGSFFL